MQIEVLNQAFTVCQLADMTGVDFNDTFCFVGKTDEEISLVCSTEVTPAGTIQREDGWRGVRIVGVLDFSLVGILSKISTILAEAKIGIFAVSTYNTDYILVKEDNLDHAVQVLLEHGIEVTAQ